MEVQKYIQCLVEQIETIERSKFMFCNNNMINLFSCSESSSVMIIDNSNRGSQYYVFPVLEITLVFVFSVQDRKMIYVVVFHRHSENKICTYSYKTGKFQQVEDFEKFHQIGYQMLAKFLDSGANIIENALC